MTQATQARLDEIRAELTSLLEVKLGELLGVVNATEEITRQLVETETEIKRQLALKERLEAQLPSLQTQRKGLTGETKELQSPRRRAQTQGRPSAGPPRGAHEQPLQPEGRAR